MDTDPRIAVVGLGYVGLPLAIALARHFDVAGYDINENRIAELVGGHDRTGEIDDDRLVGTACGFSARAADIAGRDIYIITVPTPVDAANTPDLDALRAACQTIGGVMSPGAIVVIESTVYPGVTEDVCGPGLAEASGLECGSGFFLGYSPERINPGDREHTVDRITKVVAGQTPEIADRLAAIYGRVTSGGVFLARDIRTAEAAKVIENAQRDVNIAFINEVSMIFRRAGIPVQDVLAAAGTKWNFLDFHPGLVGGHCIGVDPYYLAHMAQETGHHPEVILAGRRINDGMGAWLADVIDAELDGVARGPRRILVLGLTFKENVPDLRNSRVVDIVARLAGRGHEVRVHDPLADAAEARALYDIALIPDPADGGPYDAIVGAVAHEPYRAMDALALAALLVPGGLLADIKGIWRDVVLGDGYRRWSL